MSFQFHTCIVMTPQRRVLSNVEILKLPIKLKKNDSCGENTYDDVGIFLSYQAKSSKNAHKIASSESFLGNSEMNENSPNKCRGGSHGTPINRKIVVKQIQNRRGKKGANITK